VQLVACYQASPCSSLQTHTLTHSKYTVACKSLGTSDEKFCDSGFSSELMTQKGMEIVRDELKLTRNHYFLHFKQD